MAREMVEPTGVLDEMVRRAMRPTLVRLEQIVRAYVGDQCPRVDVEYALLSVIAQCVLLSPLPARARTTLSAHAHRPDVAAIASHVVRFSVAGLRAIARRHASSHTEAKASTSRMNRIAFQMLIGDRIKYVGMIVGVVIASFLMNQQLAIFWGLMSRTYGFITDTSYPDIWVMDDKVQFVDDVKAMQDTTLYRIRGIDGVQWAVPLYKGMIKARLNDGTTQNCIVIGLDDATLIGGPPKMLPGMGQLADLRRADAVIVDSVGRNDKLAKVQANGKSVPIEIGDAIELNDNRAIVVGVCEVSRTFQSQPVIYTTYTRAMKFAPRERKLLSFVLIGTKPGVDKAALCERIHAITGLAAYSQPGFAQLTYMYFFKYTGIPINFGISTALGFIVGTAIVGAAVLHVHARQPEATRCAQGDGLQQLDADADDAAAGGVGRRDRLRHRRRWGGADGAVGRQERTRVQPCVVDPRRPPRSPC